MKRNGSVSPPWVYLAERYANDSEYRGVVDQAKPPVSPLKPPSLLDRFRNWWWGRG